MVLVLALAGVAVLVSALSPHGSTATASPPVAAASVAGSSGTRSSATASSGTVPRGVHTQSPSLGAAPTAFVHVVGQVKSPGLYEVAAGSRLVDAIAAAGGFTASADQATLNLAQVIEDGQQVVVAVQGAAPPPAAGATAAGSKVNLNSADATALETLDGIGPALAARILAYRTAHGGFRTINDLQNVTGIGPKKFAAIKANVST